MSWRCWMAASASCSCAVCGRFSDKYDITQHPNYKYTSDADPKNARGRFTKEIFAHGIL